MLNSGKRFARKTAAWLSMKIKRRIAKKLKKIDEQVVTLSPEAIEKRQETATVKGSVLLSYMIEPFLPGFDRSLSSEHIRYWRTRQMANTFLELGYEVDVISYHNRTFLPQKKYSFALDVRHNLERLSPFLDKKCIKIMHLDTCHILFHDHAELKRLLELQRRRAKTLRPRRFEMPNLGIDHADCAVFFGNARNASTYKYASKPVYTIPVSTPVLFPWMEDKDFDKNRRNFLWFGSGGLVHKGLDLVLEAFAGLPEYNLTVCGPVEREKDFEEAYSRELYHTANIKTIGWMDTQSIQFIRLLRENLALVYPSCSESGSGSTVVCMHGGVIPVISPETGIDVHDFGSLLNDCSITGIRAAVKDLASRPVEELRNRARKTWECARDYHTKENFARQYKRIIEEITKREGKKSGLRKFLPAKKIGVESLGGGY